MYTPNHCSLICWPLWSFLLLAVQAYAVSSYVTTDDASYFTASWLSINASITLNFLTTLWQCCHSSRKSRKSLWFLFLFVTSQGTRWCVGHMNKTSWIFKQTPPPHFCLKVLCKKGHIFWSLFNSRVVITYIVVPEQKVGRALMVSRQLRILGQFHVCTTGQRLISYKTTRTQHGMFLCIEWVLVIITLCGQYVCTSVCE